MLDPTYIPVRNQSYLQMLPFEEMDLPWWRNWFNDNWVLSLYIAIAYVIIIFIIQSVMKNYQAFDLRVELAIWNFGIALFSAFAFSRVFPELFYILNGNGGIYHAVCNMEGHGMSMAFWAKTYTFSKVALLIDTVFIVLRKRRLLLLHWYHHASVLVLCWYNYMTYIPLLRFVGTMNYFVHIFMYTYYGLKAIQFKVPRYFGHLVTILELLQMILGLYVTLFAVYEYYFGSRPCTIATRPILACCVIYSTLFYLFVQFFRETVLMQERKAKTS